MFVMELINRALASGGLRVSQRSRDTFALQARMTGVIVTLATITTPEIMKIAEEAQRVSMMTPEELEAYQASLMPMAAGAENIPLPAPKRPKLTIVASNADIQPSAPRRPALTVVA